MEFPRCSKPNFTSAQPQKEKRTILQVANTIVKGFTILNTQYLEHHGISDIIIAALVEILIHKPDNPFEFLATYFEWQDTKENPLQMAYQIMSTTDYNSASFEDRILKTYNYVSQCQARENVKGLKGDVFMDFLQMISKELGAREITCLLENVFVSPLEVVPFRAFRGGLFCCLAYKEFVKQISKLFTLLVDAEEQSSVSDSIPSAKVHDVLQKMSGGLTLSDPSSGRGFPLTTVTKRKSSVRVDWFTFSDAASEIFWTKMLTRCFNDPC